MHYKEGAADGTKLRSWNQQEVNVSIARTVRRVGASSHSAAHVSLLTSVWSVFIVKKARVTRTSIIEFFHMTSRRPFWCPKPVLWELNSFLMQTLSFVPINLHRCWPREWKHSISSCKPCTIWDLNEETISPCTATKNAKCGKCNSGWVAIFW